MIINLTAGVTTSKEIQTDLYNRQEFARVRDIASLNHTNFVRSCLELLYIGPVLLTYFKILSTPTFGIRR